MQDAPPKLSRTKIIPLFFHRANVVTEIIPLCFHIQKIIPRDVNPLHPTSLLILIASILMRRARVAINLAAKTHAFSGHPNYLTDCTVCEVIK